MKKTKRITTEILGRKTELLVHPDFPNYGVTESGSVWSLKRDVLVKGRKGSDNRRMFTLVNKKGKAQTITAARLVYGAHLGPIPKGYQVNHIDHDRTNDAAENLQLVTPSNNTRLSARRRRFKYKAFGDVSVREIRKAYRAGKSQRALAHEYGVDRRTIQKLVQGKTYK